MFTRGKKQIQCGRLKLSANLAKTVVLITPKMFPYSMPVKWQSLRDVTELRPSVADWLLNTGSLTERLQALTSHFKVELLGQKVACPDESERHRLSQNTNNTWQIREVLLQGVPLETASKVGTNSTVKRQSMPQDWVFARSVLPDNLCNSTWANLGNQPLGSRIFNDDKFVRGEFEIGKLTYHPLNHKAFSPTQDFWARRSKFTIENYELLVAEAFLPDSPCYW